MIISKSAASLCRRVKPPQTVFSGAVVGTPTGEMVAI